MTETVEDGTAGAGRTIGVCDTSLRDGEQTCGVAYRTEEKLRLARLLDEMGVDCLDAGFPASSQAEREAIQAIVSLRPRARVVAFCRPNREEIDLAKSLGVDGVYTFIPTSDVHLRVKFGEATGEVRRKLMTEMAAGVAYGKSLGLFVGCGAEDATRTPYDHLEEVLVLAQENGADLVGVADTVGTATPDRFRRMIARLRRRVTVRLSLHCHNDFGLATANTIAGVLGGADEVQCTVNGLGERAGNASLEEVTACLERLYGYRTNIDLSRLTGVSGTVAAMSGIPVSPLKPLVGANAFSHESGLHVSSVLKDSSAYEPLPPEAVGHARRFVIGKHSGRSIVRVVFDAHGVPYDERLLDAVLERVKHRSVEKKSSVTEAELLTMLRELT